MKLKVHSLVHKSPPLVAILSEITQSMLPTLPPIILLDGLFQYHPPFYAQVLKFSLSLGLY
jgi:hypothetical protein